MAHVTETVLFLKQIGLFGDIDACAMEAFVANLSEQRVARNAFLFHEGEAAQSLFIVRAGMLRVVKHGPEDKRVTIRIASVGDILGEVAVLDGSPYPASAEAVENTVVLKLTRSGFLTLIRQHPDASINILSVLVRRLRDAYLSLCGMATNNVEQRVGAILLGLVRIKAPPDSAGPISIALTRLDIAEIAGCTKESVSRAMSRMKHQGILEASRGRVLVASPIKLKRFCEGSM